FTAITTPSLRFPRSSLPFSPLRFGGPLIRCGWQVNNRSMLPRVLQKPQKKSADAARVNAKAMMASEGAHLFPIIKNDNLKEIMRKARGEQASDKERIPVPSVDYCFKNYGKTPAILCRVMHGMQFFENSSKCRTMHVADELPLNIIAGERESIEFTVEL